MALLKGIVRSVFSLLLALPLLLFVVWVNYFVDQTGLFRGDKYELELAQILLGGEAVSNFEMMDERQVLELYIKNMPCAYDTMVLGSSRGLQITAEAAGEAGSFYNAGMTGEDFYDLIGTIALLDKYDRLPKNMVLVPDPWVLCDNVDSKDWRSDPNLANSFLAQTLGFELEYQPQDQTVYTKALLDLDYFQKNIDYYFEDHSGVDRPDRVQGDVYRQSTETKMPDGTLLYTQAYRERTVEEVDMEAAVMAHGEGLPFGFYDFKEPDKDRCAYIEAVIDYLQAKGVKLTIMLSPFHPYFYDRLAAEENGAPGVALTDEYFRQLGREKQIPVYGSYDPRRVNCTNEDFYDALHVKRESLSKFFYGVYAKLV